MDSLLARTGSEAGAVLGSGWSPCTEAGRWRTHQQRFLLENIRDCIYICCLLVDILLVCLVSKLNFPSIHVLPMAHLFFRWTSTSCQD